MTPATKRRLITLGLLLAVAAFVLGLIAIWSVEPDKTRWADTAIMTAILSVITCLVGVAP